MAESFDPYEQWLGIRPDEHPVDHYRMLGIPRFEPDLKKIADAADERMNAVRSYQTGRRGQYTHKILNELSSAKICLTNRGSKMTYDAVLQGQLAASYAMPQAASNPAPAMVREPEPPPFDRPSYVPPEPRIAQGAPPATSPSASRPPQYMPQEVADEPVPLMARPWFPVAVFAGVAAVLASVVIVRTWMNRPAVSPPAAPEVAVVETPPAPAETPPEPAPSNSTPVANAVVLSQEGDGGVNFPPQIAVIQGKRAELQTRDDDYVIGNWTSEDALIWRFRLVKPQHFRAHITYSTATDAEGGRFIILVDDEEREVDVRPSDPPGTFHTDEFFLTVKRQGNHTLTLRAIDKRGAEAMTFKSLRLTPFNVGREKRKTE